MGFSIFEVFIFKHFYNIICLYKLLLFFCYENLIVINITVLTLIICFV